MDKRDSCACVFFSVIYQQVNNPGGEGFKSREAQSEIFQEANQNFDPEDHQRATVHRYSSHVKKHKERRAGRSRRLRSVLLKPAGVADGSQSTLQHSDVH